MTETDKAISHITKQESGKKFQISLGEILSPRWFFVIVSVDNLIITHANNL